MNVTNARESKSANAPPARRGFTLIELMIAVVVLGLGMVMVATMFPVAWNRARRLSETSTRMSVPENADAIIKSLARVNGSTMNGNMFAGDLIVDQFNLAGPTLFTASDTRVHALHMENMAIVLKPRPHPEIVKEKPWRIERIAALLGISDSDLEDAGSSILDQNASPIRVFTSPQVLFEQRLYPSLVTRPRRPDEPELFLDPGTPATLAEAAQWDDALEASRFAWALLHRLRAPVLNSDDRREFDLFYVTLRRPKATNRYALQDPTSAPLPTPSSVFMDPIIPKALPNPAGSSDPPNLVVLPVPWRVQLWFPLLERSPKEPPDSPLAPSNIPTEVWANHEGPSFSVEPNGTDIIVDMFPTGTDFIDERNGNIYRVVKRTIVGEKQDRAILTLDREVFVEDVTDPGSPAPGAPHLRTVWVFPPPVQSVNRNNRPTFDGSEPVVGIDVRTLSLSP